VCQKSCMVLLTWNGPVPGAWGLEPVRGRVQGTDQAKGFAPAGADPGVGS
jgi:hypothetical protein